MSNREIRKEAQACIWGNFGPLMGLTTLFLLANAVLLGVFLGADRLLNGLVLGNSLEGVIARTAGTLVFLLALAPCWLGAARELVGLSQGDTPSARRALHWFGDAQRRGRAYGLMGRVIRRAALYWLAAFAVMFLLLMLQHRGLLEPEALGARGSAIVANVEACARIAIPLLLLPYLPALFFQAADLDRTPAESIDESRAAMYPVYRAGVRLLIGVTLQTGLVSLPLGAAAVLLAAYVPLAGPIALLLWELLLGTGAFLYGAVSLLLLVKGQMEEKGRELAIVEEL